MLRPLLWLVRQGMAQVEAVDRLLSMRALRVPLRVSVYVCVCMCVYVCVCVLVSGRI